MNPTIVSLFSGCGGFDLGFQKEGFEMLYACDHDPAAVACYAKNIDQHVYVRDVTSETFHQDIESIGHCDVVLGGFPCQGFSKAGPKRQEDPRNKLYLEMKRTVERLMPRVFVAENVDGLRQNFGGALLQQITKDFQDIGYHVECRILQAASYGLSQYRRRIFFVGTRRADALRFEWPAPTHEALARNGEFEVEDVDEDGWPSGTLWNSALTNTRETLLPAKTIRDAIGDLLELGGEIPDHRINDRWPDDYTHIFKAIKEGQKLCNVRHASTSVYTWDIPEVFGEVTAEERLVLQTISKNRRHKRYGSIPNGNPLTPQIISQLSTLANVEPLVEALLGKGYLKKIDGKYDLLGAMFCSGLFKRPRWNEPSPTVLTVFDNPRYFLHPLKGRPFSVRECARLQGFPDSFTFAQDSSKASLQNAYRLIGNAVPPPLAQLFAKSIRHLLVNQKEPLTFAATA